jgi:hypothetical protein
MRTAYVLALLLGAIGLAAAGEFVGVPGSVVQYPAHMESSATGKAVKLRLTGTAMRSKLILNVYSIGCYVDESATVRSAEELVSADCLKRLHLVMERTVDGNSLAEAFRSAVRMNHAAPAFNTEVDALVGYMKTTSVRKGEHIVLTHVPGVGLHIAVAGKADFLIRNVKFAQAVWEIYLGKNNLGAHIKKGLPARL